MVENDEGFQDGEEEEATRHSDCDKEDTWPKGGELEGPNFFIQRVMISNT